MAKTGNTRRAAMPPNPTALARRKAGDALPSENVLAQEYGVSRSTAHNVLVRLRDEHLIYQVNGVGSFVGSPGVSGEPTGLFVVLGPPGELAGYYRLMCTGFEERVAREGATTLSIPGDRAKALARQGDLPSVAGVFSCLDPPASSRSSGVGAGVLDGVPCVQYCNQGDSVLGADTVSFDNVDGGRQATHHLLEAGHTRIAFLALHSADQGHTWSRMRAEGWRDALTRAGVPPEEDALLMPRDMTLGEWEMQCRQGYEASQALMDDTSFTAVVATDDAAAMGLVQRLQESGREHEDWPAIVSFDDTDVATRYGFTSMRQPWEAIGAEAAGLLMERQSGRLEGPPVARLVTMRLINRATSTRPVYSLVERLVSAADARGREENT